MIIVLFVIFLIFFLFHQYYWRRIGLPPGPTPLPIFGNLFHLSNSPAPGISIFHKWKQQYGNIFTFYLGPVPFVVFTDYQEMKETIIKDGDTYADKYLSPEFNKYFRGGEYGIMDISGERWKEHRKFAVLQLREIAIGKPVMETKIIEEADEIARKLKIAASTGYDIALQPEIDIAVGSVINQFLFGYRFDEKHLFEFNKIRTLVNNFMEEVGKPLGVLAFTCHGFPEFMIKWMVSGIEDQKKEIYSFLRVQIENARMKLDCDFDENDDFVEAYLKKQKQRQEKNDYDSFCNEQLENVCFDIWAAGFDTLTNTIGFFFAYLINYPDCQKKLHDEMDTVFGRNEHRRITMSDKNSLVYFNAFTNETLRMANILPLNLPHALTKDIELKGYNLKKGTGVIHQIANVMTDESIFPESNSFKPERFIDENGKLKKIDELCPFSFGKRQCLGEGLARMELFLIAANLVKTFEFLPASTGFPSLFKDFSLVSHVVPFNCRVILRE